MSDRDVSAFVVIFIIGILLGCLSLFLETGLDSVDFFPIQINHHTANDLCLNLTGNSNAIGVQEIEGKFGCEIPSFDHSTNIIIKKAGDDLR